MVLDPSAAVAVARERMHDARAELETLVRIPSIGALREHAGDVVASAEATAALLERSGLEHVEVVAAGGAAPAVVADWSHAGDAPTVLLYAHHDVQPPGDPARWTSDPFGPVERGGRLYGRGSADDKAGVVAHAAAVASWLAACRSLPCNVRVFVEGEEELGSPRLGEFLGEVGARLAADVLVLADAGNWQVGVPGITTSMRGLAGADVRLRALDGPVHSGMGAGVIPDPVLALSRVLASLVDDRGEVAIDGFTDDVREPDAAQRSSLAVLPGDATGFGRAMGLRGGVSLVGDPERSVYEQLWLHPAVTVIGFDAHPIRGSANQIVAEAAARVSMRLAPGQDPARALDALERHVARRVPWGLELSVEPYEGSPAWACDATGWAFDAADRALTAGFGVPPVHMGVGASIPFVGAFVRAFEGVPALLLGPADPASRIHGEDESLHLDDWRKLVASEVLLLAEIAASAS